MTGLFGCSGGDTKAADIDEDEITVLYDKLSEIDSESRRKRNHAPASDDQTRACRETTNISDEQQNKYEQLQDDLSSGKPFTVRYQKS